MLILFIVAFIFGYLLYQHFGDGFNVGSQANSCVSANDGKCDERERSHHGRGCVKGTDTTDCDLLAASHNICIHANDGTCDEHDKTGGVGRCAVGTDTADCNSDASNSAGMDATKKVWTCIGLAVLAGSAYKLYSRMADSPNFDPLVDSWATSQTVTTNPIIVDGINVDDLEQGHHSTIPDGIVDPDGHD